MCRKVVGVYADGHVYTMIVEGHLHPVYPGHLETHLTSSRGALPTRAQAHLNPGRLSSGKCHSGRTLISKSEREL